MLTDRQLTETALRFVYEQVNSVLTDLEDQSADDELDKAVCADHCPGGACDRTDAGWPREIAVMRGVVNTVVADLRDRLTAWAADEGIDLKEAAR